MAPHLLTIPREIRDEIYSYLSNKVEVQVSTWCPRDTSGPEIPIDNTCFDAYLENAPLVNVLLINSQVRDEYHEAACFKKLLMVFSIYTYGDYEDIVLDTTLLEGDYMDDMKNALGKAQEITMFCDLGYGFPESLWPSVLGVTTAFQPYMLNVSTMRILAGDSNHIAPFGGIANIVKQIKKQDTTLASGRGYVSPFAPPAKLIGLPLRQCAQGYKYIYLKTDGTPPEPVGRVDTPGAWVFAREEKNIQWARSSEIIARWPIKKWPDSEVETVSKEDRGVASVLEKQIMWEERRGEDVYAWGIREENAGTEADI
ncbi:hypothetical protein PTMSG1_06570 [Pyrenophora teres f. maculata]|nr:hypothetical protein PTMSG1_06570 [Pyrenophora teres f. maculata]